MEFPFLDKKIKTNQLVRHLLYWLVFVLFFTIIWGTYDNDYHRNFMVQLFSLPSRLILVYVTLYVLFPIFFLKRKYLEFVLFYTLLLIGVSMFIQRSLMLYFVQPNYLQDWKSSDFFVVTEIMNTILDVNIAAIVPLGYTFFKIWRKTNQKTTELEKHRLKFDDDEEFIYLKVEKSLHKIFIKDIIFIESQKNYVKVKTTEREIIAYKSISSIQKSLPNEKFLRVHRSYIVGLDFIDSYSPSKLILNGVSIPIGRKYKDEVKQVLGYF